MNLRRLIGFNLLTAVVLGVVGFYVGWWLGHQITGPSIDVLRRHEPERHRALRRLPRRRDRVPRRSRVRELSGAAAARQAAVAAREGDSRASARYFGLCTDHKVVGIQYLLGIGAFIFIGGLNAMLIRFELMRPTHLVWNGNNYLTLVGVHGTMMMGMMTSGILGPFANYFVPIMIGARRMAFPRIEALTFWLLMAAGDDPDDDVRLRRLPDRLDGLRAAERAGEHGHGRLHRVLRARRPLDDAARPEHDRDRDHDARAGHDLGPAADLRLGDGLRPRS